MNPMPEGNMNKQNALSAQDAADMLGVSKSTICNMIKKGEINYPRVDIPFITSG